MRVGRIGHSGAVVFSGKTRCFMDPVLFSPFEAGANVFDPPFLIDRDAARELCTLIAISHEHADHFCPRSLNVFRRSCPVVYPRGAHLIERALDRLGFQLRVPVEAGGGIEIERLKLIATGSLFPEIGFLFQGEGHSFWNPADSVLDEAILAAVRAAAGRPDLVFANYQPLIEGALAEDALGASFPFVTYGDYLRQVWTLGARCVVPGADGASYTEEWLNQRGFPMTAAQFERDLRQVDPDQQVLQVPPGGIISIGDRISLEAQGLDFVLPPDEPGIRDAFCPDWRPDRGVPPLRDHNRHGFPLEGLPSQVDRLLGGPFLECLSQADAVWREKLDRLGVTWRLEIVYPGGEIEVRDLNFARTPLAWSKPRPDTFAKLQTSITASALVALEAGLTNRYAVDFNQLRMVNRLYEVQRTGVSWAGGRSEEPITRVLLAGADDRYLEKVLAEIAPPSSPPAN